MKVLSQNSLQCTIADGMQQGIENGWTTTPKVRLQILDTAIPLPLTGTTLTATAFPLPATQSLKLFLDRSRTTGLLSQQYSAASRSTYTANRQDGLSFSHTFTNDTILCGPLELSLSVSLSSCNDSDIFIYIEKILQSSSIGSQLLVPYKKPYQSFLIRTIQKLGLTSKTNVLFYNGPSGRIRVSRRIPDPGLSLPRFPVQRMEEFHPVTEGEIVEVKPPMTPIGMKFRAGERLRVKICGFDRSTFPPVDQATLEVDEGEIENPNRSGGVVTVHCGLDYGLASYIIVPVVDPASSRLGSDTI